MNTKQTQWGVYYWSEFYKAWVGYVAPTRNAKFIKYNAKHVAEGRAERLKHDHPRDTFKVMEVMP